MFQMIQQFVIISCLFGSVSAIRAAEPVTWLVLSSMDDQVFPSLVYSMANLKKETVKAGGKSVYRTPADMAIFQTFAKTPLAIRFSRLAPGSRASVRVKADAVMEPLSMSVDLTKTQLLKLPVAFRYDALLTIRQSKPVDISISVSVDGGPYRSQTKTVTFRSVNECPYFVFTSPAEDRGYDLRWMFAAYVNEDHPLVDQILKDALGTKIVTSFDGYQSKNVDQVRAQVRAVWTALCLRGVRYSSITASANRSAIARSQHVRLLDESVKSDQANCVDGSVLIASVLEKIGIETALVKIPGHMFLQFWLDPWLGDARKHYVCLETTLMGEGFPLPAKSTKSKAIEVADASYVRAWTLANQTFDKNSKNIHSNSDGGFGLINITEARKRGIIPIPYVRQSPAIAPQGK